jgi:hypothetical protein
VAAAAADAAAAVAAEGGLNKALVDNKLANSAAWASSDSTIPASVMLTRQPQDRSIARRRDESLIDTSRRRQEPPTRREWIV